MNTIKFNNTECEVFNFNKNTYFNNGIMSGSINCTVKTSDMSELTSLGSEEITSIQITHDEEVIYTLHDISFYLDSISEYLSGDRVDITLNLSIHMPQETEPTV